MIGARHIAVVAVAAAFGCADATRPVCTPGELHPCHCDTTPFGLRQCADDGGAWSRCVCGSSRLYTCGDGRCEVTDRYECPQDCPALCGDGTCTLDETPATCAVDCSSTSPCRRDDDCPADQRCGRRVCDGAQGCYTPGESRGYEFIGDLRRPERCDWAPCSAELDQCGPLAVCAPPAAGASPMCVRRCDDDDDCLPLDDVTALPVCNTVSHRCVLICDDAHRCPVEYACELVTDDLGVCR